VSGELPRTFFDLPNADVLRRAAAVRLLVLDVDGVLTDGGIYMGQQGELLKAFHIHDGKGISLLLGAGIEVALLTARRSDIVQQRAGELRIRHVLQGREPKWPALETLLGDLALNPSEVAYMGDDLVDLPVLRRVGLAATVADAHPWVAQHCHWQTRRAGGRGAVREVCELILAAQDKLAAVLDRYAQT
jgi:3-deoxy-D-manno-octulosonate 8-phosphate phosphatase (KDO 8-P phosphatase)